MTLAVIDPVAGQAPMGQPQWPPVSYPDPYHYRFVAPTPDDAYRQGLINRWELEQLQGPTPPALQGPSPNGSRGGSPGAGVLLVHPPFKGRTGALETPNPSHFLSPPYETASCRSGSAL